jgi:hypothetical protein
MTNPREDPAPIGFDTLDEALRAARSSSSARAIDKSATAAHEAAGGRLVEQDKSASSPANPGENPKI